MKSKLLSIAYLLFIPISVLLTRKNNFAVFGNQKGYADNTRFFFEYLSEQNSEIKVFWLANDNYELEHVRQLGYRAILKKSFKGYLISSRAKYSFICNGFSDVNRILALKSIVITFWHGTPIKKLFFDAEYTTQKLGKQKILVKISTLILFFLNRQINFYYASNAFEQVKVTSSARIPTNRSLVTGSPRFDFIRSITPPSVLLSLKENKKLILYAPTWRENENSSELFTLNRQEYHDLNNTLAEKKYVFAINLHPLAKKDFFLKAGLVPSDNIVYLDQLGNIDINEVYSCADFLITDISSAVFDFLLFNDKLAIFMPDLKEYIEGEIGIYEEFLDVLNQEATFSWGELIDIIKYDKWSSPQLFNQIAKSATKYTNCSLRIQKDLTTRFNFPSSS